MEDWKDIILKPDNLIVEALKIIDGNHSHFCIVTDEEKKLIGTITDGDIRRGLLNGNDLESPVKNIFNPNPIYSDQNATNQDVLSLMNTHGIKQLPIVDKQNQVVGVQLLDELLNQAPTIENPVVLMVGGKGTRLGSLTKECPKPMLKVGDKPILELIVSNFKEHGFKNFIFCTNYLSQIIKDHFKDGSDFGVNITYVQETEPLGTAGALGLITEKIDKPFIVMNGDILTKVNFTNLLDYHLEHQSEATICVRKHHFEIPYGVVHLDQENIEEIEEKPQLDFFVNAGVYVLSPEALKRVKPNEKLDMPCLLQRIKENQQELVAFPLREYWIDIGQLNDYQRAAKDYL